MKKWILYYNQRRKRHWVQYDADPPPEPKADLHPKKVMISVFWDDEGILYHEYLPKDETINKERYCNQLDKLRQAIQTLRPTKTEVHLLHDNARPHIAKLVKEKLETFGWNIIPHPPYSPDIAPTEFENDEEVKSAIFTFFASKPQSFFQNAISALVKRWHYIVDSARKYCPDKLVE